MLRRFFAYYRPHRGLFLLDFGCAVVSGVLELAASRTEQARQVEDLRAALDARAVIDQAIGIVMGQQRCTSDKAFDILRRASQRRNVKLRDVAAGIVMGISGQPPRRPSFRDRSLGG